MSDLFTATITGKIGRDPETRQTSAGTVLNFTVAVNSWDSRSKSELTTWVRVAVFGKRAESLAKVLAKGTQVAVSGDLRMREYNDKDGVVKTSVDLNANSVIPMFAAKQGASTQRRPLESTPDHEEPLQSDDDALPF